MQRTLIQKIIVVFSVLLGAGMQHASAGARIDLRPTPVMPPGGYAPNSVINIDVFMVDTGNPEGDIPFRFLALDFADTTGTLSFPGLDGLVGNDDDNQFIWENPFELAFIEPDLPNPSWTMIDSPDRFLITLPDGGEVHIGDINVNVGSEGGLVDVLNADDPDFQRGAVATYFPGGLVVEWRASDGEITGGRLRVLVPEPATVLLVSIASVIFIARRWR